jgi:hypothetical protein
MFKKLMLIGMLTSACLSSTLADFKIMTQTDEFTGKVDQYCRYLNPVPNRQWTMYEILKLRKDTLTWGESNQYPERTNAESRILNVMCEETGYKAELKELSFKANTSERTYEESVFKLTEKDVEEFKKCSNLKIRYGYVVKALGNTKCMEELK